VIRFRVPATALERISFAYSPLLEATLSLHVLAGPKHHSLQHGWVRRCRGLSAGLRRSIAEFGFAYAGFAPEFVTPPADGVYSSFQAELDELVARDPVELALGFLRPIYDHGGDRDPALLEDPGVRRSALQRAESLGGERLAARIFTDPAGLAHDFAGLLRAYWEEAFEAEWDELEPRLATTVAEAGQALAADGLYAFLRRLSRRLKVDEEREEFGLDLPHEHRVDVGEQQSVVLVPSVFTWPHVRLNCDEPWPLALVYPAPYVLQPARAAVPPADLSRALAALADENRLRTLKLIAERPRSTQELATLLGMTDAGMSKHLRRLAAARLVRTRREGYYVLYELDDEALRSASRAVLDFLALA
jgi:DNA-binding transcriptional ArsR family regulator